MLVRALRNVLAPQQLATGFAGLCFGVLLGILPDVVVAQGWWLVATIVGIAVVASVLSQILPKKTDLDVVIQSPLTIRSEVDALYYARKGFVGFVPLYTPKRGTNAAQLSLEERAVAVETLDFARLQLEESNLEPTLKAIVAHASQLRHCWLLSTQGKRAMGSLPYAKLIAEYLRQYKGMTCTFHYGNSYTISLDDDVLVLNKTYNLVRRVFKEAMQLKIQPRELVADITTGFRSMTLGMILACLSRERDIEFMGTRYTERGETVGDITPMALLHKGGVADGRDMVSFNYHTKTCHESSIPHPQLV
jgi:hypothetical protein